MMLRRNGLLAAVAVLVLISSGTASGLPSEPGGDAARQAFEQIKALAGKWQAESTAGWAEPVTFEVLARGSAVMSRTSFKDAPDRTMVTVFSLDEDRLVLTHYCESRTQPHLAATEISADAGTVRFEFVSGGNMASRDHGHMDQAVYEFADADTFSSRWTWYQDGEETWGEEINYRRIH
ncbi:MAG: hypothetical protein GKS06_01025 [Acidobacteria bacterium]|nr:hypothetical protein [Acidobacteriota bacterium]